MMCKACCLETTLDLGETIDNGWVKGLDGNSEIPLSQKNVFFFLKELGPPTKFELIILFFYL